MLYSIKPIKSEPVKKTWAVLIDFNFESLFSYCVKKHNNPYDLFKKYKQDILNSFYEISFQYGFGNILQENLVFSNSVDTTKTFMFINLGLKNSWIKYFIRKITIFKIEPNSDPTKLLEIENEVNEYPEWFNEELKNLLLNKNN